VKIDSATIPINKCLYNNWGTSALAISFPTYSHYLMWAI